MIQHSWFNSYGPAHSNMTAGKTIALMIQTFVSKVMSLLFNMLSRFVMAFFPRSKCLLISWLQRHKQYEKAKRYDTEDELLRLVGAQYATAEEQRNSFRRNEQAEPKQNDTQLWV